MDDNNDDIVKTDSDVLKEFEHERMKLKDMIKNVESRMKALCRFKVGDFVKFPIRQDRTEIGTVEYIHINDDDGRLYIKIKERNSTHWMTIGDRMLFYYDQFEEITLLDSEVVKNDRVICFNLLSELHNLDNEKDMTIRELNDKKKEVNGLLDEARKVCLHDMADTGEPHSRNSEQTVWRCKYCDKYGGV
jgi:hypothetical protein